jgi:hypothetical protein
LCYCIGDEILWYFIYLNTKIITYLFTEQTLSYISSHSLSNLSIVIISYYLHRNYLISLHRHCLISHHRNYVILLQRLSHQRDCLVSQYRDYLMISQGLSHNYLITEIISLQRLSHYRGCPITEIISSCNRDCLISHYRHNLASSYKRLSHVSLKLLSCKVTVYENRFIL